MSSRLPPLRVPTLTEVVVLSKPDQTSEPADAQDGSPDLGGQEANTESKAAAEAPTAEAQAAFAPAVPALEQAVDKPQDEYRVQTHAPAAAFPGEAELTARVLADVLRQVELMLEHRLREALMPALLQVSDQLVLQARTELATALNDVVSRAVTQELARHRLP